VTFTSHLFRIKILNKNIYSFLVTILDYFYTFEYPFTLGSWPQLVVVSGLSVGIPSTVGFRPQLVVSGLSVGIPLTVGFRPQFVVVSSLSVGIPLTVGFWAFTEPPAITEPFHKLFFHTMEFRLSRSLAQTFLSHNGISAITEPFTNFSFTR
jgi:hypothetical protein